MRQEERINELGYVYFHNVPEDDGDLIHFESFEQKEAVIQAWKNLYAEGRAVRGTTRTTLMKDGVAVQGYCITGLLISEFDMDRFTSGNTLAWGPLVNCNNQGPGGYLYRAPVTQKGFEEVLDLLQRGIVI